VKEGQDGFARVKEGQDGFARVKEGQDGFARVKEGQDGFARVKTDPRARGRADRAAAGVSRQRPADRVGRARPGPLSTATSSTPRPTSGPLSTSTRGETPAKGCGGSGLRRASKTVLQQRIPWACEAVLRLARQPPDTLKPHRLRSGANQPTAPRGRSTVDRPILLSFWKESVP